MPVPREVPYNIELRECSTVPTEAPGPVHGHTQPSGGTKASVSGRPAPRMEVPHLPQRGVKRSAFGLLSDGPKEIVSCQQMTATVEKPP